MALTPNDILRISEPVEQMYMDCTSQLLINLSKHFKSNSALSTRDYETQKLSELGELTNESIEIIAANTGRAPEEIKKAVTEGMGLEIQETEKVCQGAAAKGTIQSATTSWQASERVKAVVGNLVEQAVDDSNIVNTVMLNSTRERYVQAVQYATQEEARILATYGAKDVAALEGKLQLTQGVLNQATLSTAVGAEARTQAVRKAVEMVVSQGITGYIDAGGHKWSPEAYINMDIRTTVHNAAVQGQKARSADYDVQTFQISSHAGARPLCAPYQGKIYSWDGSSGVITDLYGVRYRYTGIGETSYGQPAGIFGVNCGHRPVTFVDGYSVPRFEPTMDEEENKKQYELSQKQRYLERQIRDEKTKALCYDAAGDKEAFKKSAERIKEKTNNYKAFCKANDLTQRQERTQIYGYNKSIAGKANAVTRKATEAIPKSNIKYAEAVMGDKYAESRMVIDRLASEYNTKLQEVRGGAMAHKAAGATQISGTVIELSSKAPTDAIHEFAHTLAMESQTKLGLSNDSEFWKEIGTIQREYKKAVADSPDKWISSYEHSQKGKDEFMAESFTQVKSLEMGIPLPSKYGQDLTYSSRVVAVVDNYFKKR